VISAANRGAFRISVRDARLTFGAPHGGSVFCLGQRWRVFLPDAPTAAAHMSPLSDRATAVAAFGHGVPSSEQVPPFFTRLPRCNTTVDRGVFCDIGPTQMWILFNVG
jgi:hypothetical protein